MKQETPFWDVVVVGAGLSGICAAYHLQKAFPDRRFTVLEGRPRMGGTWDLFRYPGIRSDSDMFTLGYPFYPWKNPQAIADGPSILQYMQDTIAHFGLDKYIQYNHRVSHAAWLDETKEWTLNLTEHDEVKDSVIRCRFLFMCSGYYHYQQAHQPDFAGKVKFAGKVIHPQFWDTAFDYSGKRVVVIGSGATAMTLVPEMAKRAGHVTLLQRTPTYVLAMPREDRLGQQLRKILPAGWVFQLQRWKNILMSLLFYLASKRWPKAIRKLLLLGVKKGMGQAFDARHFSPPYNPWDQRLCVVPNGDLFQSLKSGKADMVTDEIAEWTETGIQLRSGRHLDADVIVTATGLKLQMLGGMMVSINGKSFSTGEAVCYRGVLIGHVPNFALAVGYTNASWTLKCDLNCRYVVRVLKYMYTHDLSVCTPRPDEKNGLTEPFLDLSAGYVQRAKDILPKQGKRAPWKVYQNYLNDRIQLLWSSVRDRYLEYR
jgi:monooxygenase